MRKKFCSLLVVLVEHGHVLIFLVQVLRFLAFQHRHVVVLLAQIMDILSLLQQSWLNNLSSRG